MLLLQGCRFCEQAAMNRPVALDVRISHGPQPRLFICKVGFDLQSGF